jgi:hypothetical protein
MLPLRNPYTPAEHSTRVHSALPRLLSNSLVAVAVVPLLAIREQPVDHDSTNREDEHEDRPQ